MRPSPARARQDVAKMAAKEPGRAWKSVFLTRARCCGKAPDPHGGHWKDKVSGLAMPPTRWPPLEPTPRNWWSGSLTLAPAVVTPAPGVAQDRLDVRRAVAVVSEVGLHRPLRRRSIATTPADAVPHDQPEGVDAAKRLRASPITAAESVRRQTAAEVSRRLTPWLASASAAARAHGR